MNAYAGEMLRLYDSSSNDFLGGLRVLPADEFCGAADPKAPKRPLRKLFGFDGFISTSGASLNDVVVAYEAYESRRLIAVQNAAAAASSFFTAFLFGCVCLSACCLVFCAASTLPVNLEAAACCLVVGGAALVLLLLNELWPIFGGAAPAPDPAKTQIFVIV